MTKKELHQLITESIHLVVEKKLCPKGKAYYDRRIKTGEKPSAYLSGRAVKVCKGLMEGDEEMVHCDNCGWEWKLADGGNDPFTCHKCGNESSLIKEDINLQTIRDEDEGIQKAAGELNLPYDTIYTSFIKGKEVTLNDDMWSRLENTNSYNINSEGEAIELTRQYNENYQNVSFNEKLQHALILQYSPNKFYLIGGDDSLIFARAKGINPQVILATIEPTAKWAYQNVTGGIDEDCGCDDDVEEYDVESEDDYEGFIMFMKEYARQLNESKLTEAEYRGRKVQLGKIMQGDIKKFKVYVKNGKGKVVKVNFGFGGKSAKGKRMVIKAKNPKRRAAYRARHNCSNPGPRWKANYWSCKKW
jgi:hypothetical protein